MKLPTYTKSDRRAMIMLAIIAILAIVGIVLFGTSEDSKQVSSNENQENFENSSFNSKVSEKSISSKTYTAQSTSSSLHIFDPNTVDSATLVSFGISPGHVKTFIHYRLAGAVFRKPTDIARCYSFSDDDIDKLLPYIRISKRYQQSKFKRDKYPINENLSTTSRHWETSNTIGESLKQNSIINTQSSKFTTLTPVNINTADTALLRRIPGVGEGISSMIINLRNKLGGFTSVSQLSAIPQISQELMDWFEVGENDEIRKININVASFKTLVTHPYISADQTKQILNYIRLYGKIESIGALQSTNIFTPEELGHLSPYLEF